MHTFLPDFRMLRSLTACVLLLFTVLAVPAQTNKKIKQLQSQRNELKKQIAESEKMLRSTKKDVRSQLGNLVVLNTQIGEQQKFVEGIQSEISLLDGDISVLEKRLDSLGRDLSSCKAKYQRAVMYMFRNRLTQSRWMFVLQAKDFRQMYRRMRYVTEYTKYQRVQGEVIRRKEENVKARQAELQAARKEKDKLLSEGRSEQQKLEERKRERETLVERLKGKESQLQASINQTRKKYSNLNARIDQLIQQEIAAAERRRKQAEARRKAEAERKRREQAAREKASRSGARSQASRGKSSSRSSSRPERTAVPDFQAADNADRVLSGSHRSLLHLQPLRTIQGGGAARRASGQQGYQHHRPERSEGTVRLSGRGDRGLRLRRNVQRDRAPRQLHHGLLQPFLRFREAGAESLGPPDAG